MATESKKHSNFLATPLKDAKVEHLPGIGAAMAEKLKHANVKNAKQLMGQYLVRLQRIRACLILSTLMSLDAVAHERLSYCLSVCPAA